MHMNMQTLELALKIASTLTSDMPQPKASACSDPRVGQKVLIRTYAAGVHFGTLKARNGTEVTLSNARRIWSWNGANTLHEIATTGIDQSQSNVSQPVLEIDLTNVIEVIPLTEFASTNLEGCTWSHK